MTRNTIDRNFSGIHVGEGSHRNLVASNSLTSNHNEAIGLFAGATENTLEDNSITGSWTGIILTAGDGADHNLIQGNIVMFNLWGIWVDFGSTDNIIQRNALSAAGPRF